MSSEKGSHENIESDFDESKLYQINNMSLYETKGKLEWRKCAFECECKSTYDIEIHNVVTSIHDKKVNNIPEYNLLHDILNPPKRTKKLNSHYSPIIHGCMNTWNCKEKFKNFLILLNSGCSSTIAI